MSEWMSLKWESRKTHYGHSHKEIIVSTRNTDRSGNNDGQHDTNILSAICLTFNNITFILSHKHSCTYTHPAWHGPDSHRHFIVGILNLNNIPSNGVRSGRPPPIIDHINRMLNLVRWARFHRIWTINDFHFQALWHWLGISAQNVIDSGTSPTKCFRRNPFNVLNQILSVADLNVGGFCVVHPWVIEVSIWAGMLCTGRTHVRTACYGQFGTMVSHPKEMKQ